ncbi:MAG: hypothetical protein K2J31_00850, partial [Alistipes sp.]|nr:hypothetical protein [Alistipes sp.]
VWLFAAVMAMQILLLDNLSLSMWLRPMIFPAVILLLPIEWRTVWVLLAAAATGWILDGVTGCQGLYTASLLPLAMVRPAIIRLTANRGVEQSDQTELLPSLSRKQLLAYISVSVVLHHALFFALESMSATLLWYTVAKIAAGSLLSILLSWLVASYFMSKISAGQ